MAYKADTAEYQSIRALVEAVEREVIVLRSAPDHRDASASLAENWTALVRWLALDAAPRTRQCPTCGKTVMQQATTCGYCWAHLPLPE